MRIFINVIRRINMPFDYKKEYKEFSLRRINHLLLAAQNELHSGMWQRRPQRGKRRI